MGVVSGWNLWVWLECIGVVSGCCCKEVYRYSHNITYPYSTCISSFLQQHPYFFLHFYKCFFVLVYYIQWVKIQLCHNNDQNDAPLEHNAGRGINT